MLVHGALPIRAYSKQIGLFENRLLGGKFGPMRQDVTGGCRKLYNEIRDFYCSPCFTRVVKCMRMRWGGDIATNGKDKKFVKSLGLKIGRERNHGYRWQDVLQTSL
jgi:hypothetical protein